MIYWEKLRNTSAPNKSQAKLIDYIVILTSFLLKQVYIINLTY